MTTKRKRLSLSAIGCGNRVSIYMGLAAQMKDRYEIVAAADPNQLRVARIKELSGNPEFKSFADDKSFFAEDQLSDVVIIGTQDNYHYEPCKAALLKGYDVLLEKPIAPCMEETLELQDLAEKLGRKLQVCYVLRYTPFYRKVKEIIDSGILGDIVSINAAEGVDPWHQAHSYVRGKWRDVSESSPMIVAKCSHDTDILGWLTDKRCLSVSSYGSLSHFCSENRPEGATERCTDGCPHLDTCHYNAYRYAGEHRTPWLELVHDNPLDSTNEEVIEWLKESKYGRCVYDCDNDAVDHQVVNMLFEDDVTATFTMTAFDIGRSIEIFATKGMLKGGHFYKQVSGTDIHVETFAGEKQNHVIDIREGDHHMGGDYGLMEALYDEMAGDQPVPVRSYIQSHVMSYAAEHARIHQVTVDLEEFADSCRGQE